MNGGQHMNGEYEKQKMRHDILFHRPLYLEATPLFLYLSCALLNFFSPTTSLDKMCDEYAFSFGIFAPLAKQFS